MMLSCLIIDITECPITVSLHVLGASCVHRKTIDLSLTETDLTSLVGLDGWKLVVARFVCLLLMPSPLPIST